MIASLVEAMRWGDAVHEAGWPWRIVNGQPEVGIPIILDGELVREGEGFLLEWKPIETREAHQVFSKTGWVLLT